MAGGSATAVYAAIIGNSFVMCAKFAAFAVTGSGSMLSEGIHSAADVSNQALLALGIARSKRAADPDHPYGYGPARFVWSLISAVGIFFLGCGITVYHGINSLFHPHEIESPEVAIGVLILSFVIEGATLAVAYKAVGNEARKQGMDLRTYAQKGSDPTGVAVLLEDAAAVLGVLIAGVALTLSWYTGDTMWDALGSITVGILLGLVAIFLINRNREVLIGMQAPDMQRTRILKVLAKDPVVEAVRDVKTSMLGADGIRFKAEIEFDGEEVARRWLDRENISNLREKLTTEDEARTFLVQYGDHLIDFLADEIDRLESDIRKAVPEVRHVDIEAD